MKAAMTEYEIHPAIGIARVGRADSRQRKGISSDRSPTDRPPAKYRDPEGNLKRQAARFRVFACRRDDQRRLLDATELTPDSVRRLTWTVHFANRKGVARRQYGFKHGFRNRATARDDQDRALIIDPDPRSVRAPGKRPLFDTGKFRSATVPLGEVVMEADGRLLVLGGHGRSGSDPPLVSVSLWWVPALVGVW
jgi:L-lysine epsilon oxidase-like protein